jgi:chromosome segregation ATPase
VIRRQSQALEALERHCRWLAAPAPVAWQLANFPPDVRRSVAAIADDAALAPEVRLNGILAVVGARMRECADAEERCGHMRAAVQKFFARLEPVVPGQAPSAELLRDEAGAAAFAAKLAELRDASAQKGTEVARLGECLREIYARLRAASFVDALRALERLFAQLDAAAAELERAKDAALHAKKEAKRARGLQRRVAALTDEARRRQDGGLETDRAGLEEVLGQRDEALAQLSRRIAQYERALGEGNRTIASLRAAVAEKDERLKQRSLEMNDRAIADIKREHNVALESMQVRVSELQALASKYRAALAESEARSQSLLEKLAGLQVANERMATKIDFHKDGRSREQHLADARIQALELSAGTEKQIELDELRLRFEKDQRSLAAFIANTFPLFIDGHKELDNDAIREAVTNAAGALAQYEQEDTAIRRLLGISKSDSCEAAIARCLQ